MKNSHLCKEDYEEIKRTLSMRQVVEFYGYQVNQKGTCLCPFHNDGHPSMKIYADDKGFYCFSCGSGGDVITFTSLLFGMRNEQAARKLIDDFSLPIHTEELSYREQREREKRIRRRKELDKFKKEAYVALTAYRWLLCDAIRDPGSSHFAEAAQELSLIEYRLLCLETDLESYYGDGKAVKRVGEIRERVINWYGGPDGRGAISR